MLLNSSEQQAGSSFGRRLVPARPNHAFMGTLDLRVTSNELE